MLNKYLSVSSYLLSCLSTDLKMSFKKLNYFDHICINYLDYNRWFLISFYRNRVDNISLKLVFKREDD